MNFRIRAIILSILDFLGSMSFAITLLLSVSIVALIGALVAQGQSDAFYLHRFGPFWAQLFTQLSVTNIFASSGFLILVFLLFLSIGICIWRRAPGILQEFSDSARLQPDSKAEYTQHSSWHSPSNMQDSVAAIEHHLRDNRYKYSHHATADQSRIIAHKGTVQRLGYLAVHFGVLIIILGALLDSNLPLRLSLDMDKYKLSDTAESVADSSLLDTDSGAFRGAMDLGIKQKLDYVTVRTEQGYLRRQLPFSIALHAFNISYYSDGTPKDFSSDIVVTRKGQEPRKYKVDVEKGVDVDGYRIYQRKYHDAGSALKLQLWDLNSTSGEGMAYDFSLPMQLSHEQTKLPVDVSIFDFVKDNENPLQSHTLQQKFVSIGPALHARTVNTQGYQTDIVYYIKPIIHDGKKYYLVGIQQNLDKTISYGYIPASNPAQLEHLIKLNALLNDRKKINQIIYSTAKNILKDLDIDSRLIRKDWVEDMQTMYKLFLEGGSHAVVLNYQPSKPTNNLDELNAATQQRLQDFVEVLYTYVLDDEKDLSKNKDSVKPRQLRDFDEIYTALDWMKTNHLQVLFKVNQFKHHQGSTLEVSYYPGYYPVLGGMLLLLLGILVMFYIHHRRLEILVTSQPGGGCEIRFIGSARKSPVTLQNEYDRLLKVLR